MTKNLVILMLSLVFIAGKCDKDSRETAPPTTPTEEIDVIDVEEDAPVMDIIEDEMSAPITRGEVVEESEEVTYFKRETNAEGEEILTEHTVVGETNEFTEEGVQRLDITVTETGELIRCQKENIQEVDLWVEIGGETGERN